MDKVIKKKWVAALRSGDYIQAKGTLRNNVLEPFTGYCCLGVLYDVIGGDWDELVGTDGAGAGVLPGLLPTGILREIGLNHKTQQSLARMNDHGKTFDQIANHIEKRIKED